MLTLYHSGLSTCSKQVRHCLREKGLDYESRYVELWRYENLSDEYLALNPNGVVPTLVHDGDPIINSFCINEYLDDAFPEPPLRPADPKDRARMRYWAWTADDVHLSIVRITYTRMLLGVVSELSPEDQALMMAHTPVPEKRERWRRMTTGGYQKEEIEAALNSVRFQLSRMEEELSSRGPWLAGKTFSLGDVSMLAIVHRTSELHPELLDKAKLPALNDWWARVMARPAAAWVYTDGTEETPARPPGKSVAGITAFHA